ncbi:DUF4157 domain-containing protein [Amycolatopsis sp. NBC_00345]|uniref:eCIS core domain-containing protein n=1 Tax=Amycolatopsis sp. NBC_00345 TaxID=2975955 RepID=UPI002E272C24
MAEFAVSQGKAAPPEVHDVLRSPGEPLAEDVRAGMHARFGTDFSQVRVHTDAAAAASAVELGAQAYTVGRHIAFAPGTVAGRQLLTHVVQQGRGDPIGALAVSEPGEAAEHHAARIAGGAPATGIAAAPNMVHRAMFGKPVQHSRLTGDAAVIPLRTFLGYVQEVERANPGDDARATLSRLRVQYYGGGGFADWMKFGQLIPDAPGYDETPPSSPIGEPVIAPKGLGDISRDAREHLLARADENADVRGAGDNPSPYSSLPNGQRVDIGHLLLELDALLHPRTAAPYTTFGVPDKDVSGWVADVGIASVWMTLAEAGHPHPDDPVVLRHQGKAGPPAEYFQSSAPDEDLLGDIDAVRLRGQWAEQRPSTLSSAIRTFYYSTPRPQTRPPTRQASRPGSPRSARRRASPTSAPAARSPGTARYGRNSCSGSTGSTTCTGRAAGPDPRCP